MRTLLIFVMTLPLAAQQTPPPAVAPPSAPAAAAPAQTPAPAADPAPSPVPSTESWLSGYLEVGYRGLTGVGGSEETYRSVVNLGSGVKLTGTDFTILDPKKRLFERLRVRADGWGDPWASFHLFVEKRGIYKILADVRSLTYFNNLPSYADPTLSRGIVLDQQSFDTRRHFGSYDLELFNNHRVSPYVMYDHDASSGHGVTVFQSNADEFPVPATFSDSTELYRGGAHITGARYHVTLEAGGTTFKSDQNTYTSTTLAPNPGNNLNPVLGQDLYLTSLLQAYGIRGNSVFTRVTGTATPYSWLDLFGHFLYSEPRNNLNYQQFNTGNFIVLSQALFYNSEQYLVSAAAKLPHTTGNVGAEIRPLHGIRILESWTTDRLHNAGSASQMDTLFSGTPATSTLILNSLTAALATNYSQNEITVIADATKTLTLRGGYRYVWGDARDIVLPPEALPSAVSEKLRRNVGLGAATWRPGQKFSITGELEAGSSTGAYFRTSLYNYTKLRGIARYQLLSTLRLSADYNVLSNRNPNAGSNYYFLSHQETLALDWNPKGDRFTIDGSYSHCSYHSEIGYLIPQTLDPATSIYRENCHSISGYLNGSMRGIAKGSKIQLVAGGSAVITSGSRPTTYYQPTAKLSVPLTKNVGVFAEWRYYGLGEAFYGYESFRAHLITAGLRYSR
jgi:hypothetical protein